MYQYQQSGNHVFLVLQPIYLTLLIAIETNISIHVFNMHKNTTNLPYGKFQYRSFFFPQNLSLDHLYANDLITHCVGSIPFIQKKLLPVLYSFVKSHPQLTMSAGKGHNYLTHCLFHCLFIVKGKIGPCFKLL